MVHAQDEHRIEANRARLAGGRTAADHSRIQDLECELAAVRRYLDLADRHGVRITICHVSSADALELIAEHAHKRGERRVLAEAAPHYWALDRSWLEREDGTLYQMNPALREPEQRARMERALVDADLVDYVATDHAPHTLEEKRRTYGQAPSGVPGVESSLALLWTYGRPHGMTLSRFSALVTHRPSAVYGLGLGDLQPCDPAKVILFDPTRQWTISSDTVRSKCGWTPYDGCVVTGRVEATVLGGNVVYRAPDTAVRTIAPCRS
jgi:dihydroorotase